MESLESEPEPNPYHLWAEKRHPIYEMGKLTTVMFGGGGRVESLINLVEEQMIAQINNEVEDYERRAKREAI